MKEWERKTRKSPFRIKKGFRKSKKDPKRAVLMRNDWGLFCSSKEGINPLLRAFDVFFSEGEIRDDADVSPFPIDF
jgi:hypothetical protein